MQKNNIVETIADDFKVLLENVEVVQNYSSPFQKIEIVGSKSLGRVFRLDGFNMTSEADEFLYHEPMNHIGLLAQASPKNALVIGGGDGGSVDEIIKHPSIEKVHLVELDAEVISISRAWFAKVHNGALDNPKLTINIADGFVWMREFPKNNCEFAKFDLIVMDLTDPVGPAENLYSLEFFNLVKSVLAPTGCLSLHIGHAFFHQERFFKTIEKLRQVFKFVCPLTVSIPIYGGAWGMAIVSDTINVDNISEEVFAKRIKERNLKNIKWLNAKCLKGAFALPQYLVELINNDQ